MSIVNKERHVIRDHVVDHAVRDYGLDYVGRNEVKEVAEEVGSCVSSSATPWGGVREYHGLPHAERDVLEKLKDNINQLEEMHARLHFLFGEINYLLKKSP